ncbi:MAG: carbohydrate ABC transporter permease [Christensenellaceae bacterium]
MTRQKASKLTRRENIIAFLFILPPIIGFCIFTIGAMAFSFVYSFQKYNILTGESTWLGWQNYKDLFTHILYSKSFYTSIVNTLVLLLSIPLSMILGLCLAGLLRMGDIKGAKVFQVLYYLPAVSSAVAMNIVWRYIFNNEFGIINLIIGKKIPWLSDDTLIKVAIIIKNSLNGMGTAMILYLAGMLSVPKDYYEASELDGAGKVKQFFSITLPLITPITFYLLITGLIGGLQSYTDSQIFGAGVQGSQTIVYFIWARGINQSRYGLASAASVLLAVVIMIVTLIQFKLSDKWVYEE